MKRLFAIILMIATVLCSLCGCSQSDSMLKGLEKLQNKAYFAVDTSFEEWYFSQFGVQKNRPWCAIIGNQITLSAEVKEVYQIKQVENAVFSAENGINNISFWEENGILHIARNNMEFRMQEDTSYIFNAQKQRKLEMPQDVSVYEGEKFITFEWGYRSEYGVSGAGVQLKTSGSEKVQLIDIEYPYMNEFVVQIDRSMFTEGENYIYLRHFGGPMINNNQELFLEENSEVVVFVVMLNGDDCSISKK